MQYMLLYVEPEHQIANVRTNADAPEYWGAWSAYMDAMGKAGVIQSGQALQPAHTATTVRVRDGGRAVQDGPFIDSKDQLGGYVIIDVPDLDAALEWAAQAPCAQDGCVEVRPVLPMSEGADGDAAHAVKAEA